MAFNALRRLWLLLAAFGCFLSACTSYPAYKPAKFSAEQVSCTDISSPELRAQLDAVRDNPDGDPYLIQNINRILPMMNELANKGNIHGMLVYGDIEYEYQYLLHQGALEAGEGFPTSAQANLIDALTYVSLSAMTDSPDKHSAKQLRKEIEKRIPAEWANEAKANAQRWKAYCTGS